MEAATWTAIAVLAAANLGTLFYLGARIDALGARLDAVATDLGGWIDALSARIDAQNGRIDTLSVTMADHIRRHAG